MSAGDLPERPAPTPAPIPGPTPGPARGPAASEAAGAVGAAGAAHRPGVDESTGADDVLADLAALPADAPVLDHAVLLEDVQERLAQRLSGAAR